MSKENEINDDVVENKMNDDVVENKINDDVVENKMNDDVENKKVVSVKKSTFTGLIIGIIVVVGVAAFFAGTYVSSSYNNQISNEDLNNAIAKLELKLLQNQLAPQQAPQPTQNPNQPTAPTRIAVSVDDDPVKGDPNAPITVIEFSDFQCPFCLRFYEQTLPLIEENYIETGKIKFVYRDLPIQSIHPNAFPVHIAAECADEQGKFWDYHDILFEKQNEWNKLSVVDLKQKIMQYASDLALNTSNFELCLESDAIKNEIKNDLRDSNLIGATGTPAFYVGNDKLGYIKISGAQPYSVFSQIIDRELRS